jgi:hypothetical protein
MAVRQTKTGFVNKVFEPKAKGFLLNFQKAARAR